MIEEQRAVEYDEFRAFLRSAREKAEGHPSEGDGGDADMLKKQGNDFFKLECYEQAVEAYTRALALAKSDEMRGTLFSNRSIAYMKIERKEEALEDGREAVRLLPNLVKSYNRLCTALLALHQYQECIEVAERGTERGKGLSNLHLEATRGLFNQTFAHRRLVQDKDGILITWSFCPPSELKFEVMSRQVSFAYYIFPNNILRIVDSATSISEPKDYEYMVDGTLLYVKLKNEDGPYSLLLEEESINLPRFETEEEYIEAWGKVLPDMKGCEESNATEADSQEAVAVKSRKRLLLIQELRLLKQRGEVFHHNAMEAIKTNICYRHIRKRMAALQMIELEKMSLCEPIPATPSSSHSDKENECDNAREADGLAGLKFHLNELKTEQIEEVDNTASSAKRNSLTPTFAPHATMSADSSCGESDDGDKEKQFNTSQPTIIQENSACTIVDGSSEGRSLQIPQFGSPYFFPKGQSRDTQHSHDTKHSPDMHVFQTVFSDSRSTPANRTIFSPMRKAQKIKKLSCFEECLAGVRHMCFSPIHRRRIVE